MSAFESLDPQRMFHPLIRELCADLAPVLVGYELVVDRAAVEIDLVGTTGRHVRLRLNREGFDVTCPDSRAAFLRREAARVRAALDR